MSIKKIFQATVNFIDRQWIAGNIILFLSTIFIGVYGFNIAYSMIWFALLYVARSPKIFNHKIDIKELNRFFVLMWIHVGTMSYFYFEDIFEDTPDGEDLFGLLFFLFIFTLPHYFRIRREIKERDSQSN